MGAGRVTKRRSKTIDVPSLDQDAAERKRLLNVLAQRRYRERKKEKLELLEAKVNAVIEAEVSSTSQSPEGNFLELPRAGTSDQTLPADYIVEEDSLHLPDVSSEDTTTPGTSSELSLCFASDHSQTDYSSISNTTQSPPMLDECWDFEPPANTTEDNYNFPDELFLPVLELNLMRAGVAIAKTLGTESIMWELSALSPFAQSGRVNYEHLPSNMRPTFLQLTVQHHPFMDLLPWPSVRDKLILIFSQPEYMRPPVARSPTALVDFVYDMEDPSEGIRVTGADPFAGENWEVGQAIFKKWWWAFSKDIIENSNRSRRNRGASALGGMIVGDVS